MQCVVRPSYKSNNVVIGKKIMQCVVRPSFKSNNVVIGKKNYAMRSASLIEI
jgi:hypothetical protein